MSCRIDGCASPRSLNGATLCNSCRSLRWRYSLTDGELATIVAAKDRGELCPICHENLATHVDHCHKRGHVRGLICGGCNTLLGVIEAGSVEYELSDYLHADNLSPGSIWKLQKLKR